MKIIPIFLSLLFLSACAVTHQESSKIDLDKDQYVSDANNIYPDASVVGLAGTQLSEQLQRYKNAYGDSLRLSFSGDSAITTINSDILFDFDSYELKNKEVIDDLLSTLKNEGVSISLVGHTDSTGDAEYNNVLSLKRAKAVEEYLQAHSTLSILSVTGMGEHAPVAPNTTSAGRAKNRRVEFIIKRLNNGGQ